MTASRTSSDSSVAVIGCGAFGAMAALRLARANCDVTVYERLPEILSGASFNNQNRLHLGFHYPRDVETARQCVRGFTRFKESFHEAILGDFPNAYFIASQGSHVSPDDYLAFCEGLQLPYEVVDIGGFEPRVLRVDLGLLVDEVVYDCQTLRTVLSRRLSESSAKVQVSVEVESVRRTSSGFMLDIDGLSVGPYDAIVNCTYSDINRFANELGHEVPLREFEYTMVPVLEWNEDPVGITIMDGPFMTILPFGHTNRFLLYHVEHTVLAREVGHHLDRAWLDPGGSPGAQLDRDKFLESILGACREYVPSLASAKPVGFLQGPRVVLANRGMTDARPSIVEAPEPGYVSVFAGKIDHCVWVADEVAEKLGVD